MGIITNPISALVLSSRTINTSYLLNNNIDIDDSPAIIAASENPANYIFSASAITGTESFATVGITVTAVPPDDVVFVLSAATIGYFPTYTISAVAEPRLNECYSTATTPSRTITEVADSIAASLMANQSFRQRFVATYSSDTVTVTALNPGEKYNIDFGQTAGVDCFDVVGPTYSSNMDISQAKKDWAITCDLFVGGVGNYGEANVDRTYGEYVCSFESNRDNSNQYIFDCAGAVKNYLTTNFPEYEYSATMDYTNGHNNYWLVFSEKYDEFNNNFRRKFLCGQTNVRWLFNSSLDFDQVNTLTGYTILSDATTLTGTNRKRYLTNQPSVKLHYPGSKEYLSNIYEGGLTSWFETDIKYVDGTTSSAAFLLQNTTINSASGGCWTAMVTPPLLSATTYNGKLVKSFVVTLIKDYLGADAVQCYDQEYLLVHDCDSEGQKQLCWHNELGGFDTFTFNGQVIEDVDRKIKTFNIPLQLNNNSVEYSTVDSIEIEKNYKLHSGFVNKEHFNWLKNIFKSSDVRVQINDEWQRIVITKGEAKGTTNDDLFKIELEYQLALPENYIKK